MGTFWKTIVWSKTWWRETAGIRHFVDKVSQDVKSLRNYLQQYHEKQAEAGIKYTLCKLGESSDTDLKMADAKRQETHFQICRPTRKNPSIVGYLPL